LNQLATNLGALAGAAGLFAEFNSNQIDIRANSSSALGYNRL
jgi:hypothetical protein